MYRRVRGWLLPLAGSGGSDLVVQRKAGSTGKALHAAAHQPQRDGGGHYAHQHKAQHHHDRSAGTGAFLFGCSHRMFLLQENLFFSIAERRAIVKDSVLE